MIPTKFLSKMGVYEFQIRGVTMKVRVADNPDIVDMGVSELKSQFGTTVVGLNIHSLPKSICPALLELCVGSRCLIVQLAHMRSIPEGLKRFLADKEICFVGISMCNAMSKLRYRWEGFKCNSGVELSYLVARCFKKPNLIGRGLEELACEVGVELKEKEESGDHEDVKVDWSAKVFSEEQIKCVVRDVHAFYLIANKILE